jgi:hypothetical protein
VNGLALAPRVEFAVTTPGSNLRVSPASARWRALFGLGQSPAATWHGVRVRSRWERGMRGGAIHSLKCSTRAAGSDAAVRERHPCSAFSLGCIAQVNASHAQARRRALAIGFFRPYALAAGGLARLRCRRFCSSQLRRTSASSLVPLGCRRYVNRVVDATLWWLDQERPTAPAKLASVVRAANDVSRAHRGTALPILWHMSWISLSECERQHLGPESDRASIRRLHLTSTRVSGSVLSSPRGT